MENIVERVLKENCTKQDVFFVFPTQTAVDLWSDKIIQISSVTAIASERFIAWDDFKGTAVRGKEQNRRAIPSSVRKFFAQTIIRQNAGEPFLKNVIPVAYASSASNFSNYISSLLPSLAMWKKYFDKSSSKADEVDEDLQEIYNRYKAFLDKHSLFDPAWETPPFESNGKKYYIFFPEILSDYIEYKEILSSSKDITIVSLPEESESDRPPVSFFSNSRQEIKNVALYLKKIHAEKNIPWNKMAVSIPDMENYRPYVERDFDLYEIPYVLRDGLALSSYGAGAFFSQLKDCLQNNFSFESLKTLLLNNRLPWLEKELNEALIDFGRENNCICSFDEKGCEVDVWLKSFEKNPQEEHLKRYYKMLKEKISNIVRAKSFSEVRKFYFELRDKIFDKSKFSPISNAVIGRCISELGNLIDLEDEFADCLPSDPYSFFTSALAEKKYLSQTEDRGVQLLPYKLSATAPFDVQVVVDSSQAALSVVYKILSFLPDEKRTALGITEDPDVSSYFIRLYAMNADKYSYFTSASKTFNAYSISHSFFIEKAGGDTEIEGDSYQSEKDWFLDENNSLAFPKKIMGVQKKAFDFWSQVQDREKNISGKMDFSERLATLYTNGKLKISASSLNSYFSCPRSFLFEKLLKLEEVKNEAELMNPFARGNLYHSIMEKFCKNLKKKNLALDYNDEYKEILSKSLDAALAEFRASYLAKLLLDTTRNSFFAEIEATVKTFCAKYKGCTVDAVEEEYDYYPEGKDYYFSGRIDCLLYSPDPAEFILIDFKSSTRAIHKDIFYVSDDVEIPDMQMPIYLYMLENQSDKKKRRKVENAAFFNVNTSDEKNRNVPYLGELSGIKEEVDLEKTNEAFLKCAETFAENLKVQKFDVDDKRQDYNVCRSCAYKAVCRRTFTVSRGK